jgi:hypothetical protein
MRGALALLALVAACADPHPAGDDAGSGDDAGTTGDGGVDPDADPGVDAPPNTACPTWCMETPPAGAAGLHAVWAVNGNDVFAVGDAGTIVRRQNNAWTKMTSGTTANLRSVWGAASNDVWAVGEAGTILRFDGTAWAPVAGVTTSDVAAVWGSSASNVWLAATSKMYRWNGSAWSNTTVVGSMQGLSGTGPNDIWLATEGAYAKHYTGTTWATVMPGASSTVFAVLALSASNVWASTDTQMRSYNGSTWTGFSTSNAVFVSLYGTAAANVWGVGGTKIGHWTGAAWDVTTPAGVTMSLRGVHGTGTDVWVVGSGPTILHRN